MISLNLNIFIATEILINSFKLAVEGEVGSELLETSRPVI